MGSVLSLKDKHGKTALMYALESENTTDSLINLLGGKNKDLEDYGTLCSRLVDIVQAGLNWAESSGYPVVENYPQYDAIRLIGKKIYRIQGIEGMQEACRILQAKIYTRDGGGKSYPAEKAWEGIGNWAF